MARVHVEQESPTETSTAEAPPIDIPGKSIENMLPYAQLRFRKDRKALLAFLVGGKKPNIGYDDSIPSLQLVVSGGTCSDEASHVSELSGNSVFDENPDSSVHCEVENSKSPSEVAMVSDAEEEEEEETTGYFWLDHSWLFEDNATQTTDLHRALLSSTLAVSGDMDSENVVCSGFLCPVGGRQRRLTDELRSARVQCKSHPEQKRPVESRSNFGRRFRYQKLCVEN